MAKLEPGKFCPLIKRDCVGIKCSWYVQVRGTNPNSGNDVDEWACAVAWTPILLINTANETRVAGAETEALRKEIRTASENALRTQLAIAHLQGVPSLPGLPSLMALEKKDGS